MRFDDYEKSYETVYAEFAETVKFILEKAIGQASGIPRPQSVQCRAKSAASLKPKLQERGRLESDSIETEVKDLAGVRLIFYTNTDVNRFLNSRLIPENFAIDRDATKIHHPTKENKGDRYQAFHDTVRMTEERAKLPEYAKFKGMRCEIQIQTILKSCLVRDLTRHNLQRQTQRGLRQQGKGINHQSLQSDHGQISSACWL